MRYDSYMKYSTGLKRIELKQKGTLFQVGIERMKKKKAGL